jgi:hypothetical protein
VASVVILAVCACGDSSATGGSALAQAGAVVSVVTLESLSSCTEPGELDHDPRSRLVGLKWYELAPSLVDSTPESIGSPASVKSGQFSWSTIMRASAPTLDAPGPTADVRMIIHAGFHTALEWLAAHPDEGRLYVGTYPTDPL